MAVAAQNELKAKLTTYDDAIKERDTLLNAFRSLLHNRSNSSRNDFLAKVRRFFHKRFVFAQRRSCSATNTILFTFSAKYVVVRSPMVRVLLCPTIFARRIAVKR